MTTLTLTIGTETREVEVYDNHSGGEWLRTCGYVGAYRKGSGKVWRYSVSFRRQADGSYRAKRTGVFLNRDGYVLVGWADTITKTRVSKHNSALPEAGQ